jgi:L-aspartate oxidase
MEFIQFALGLRKNGTTAFLATADLVQPQKVVDSVGRDILKRYIPDESDRAESVQRRRQHMPFSCRDASGLVDLAIARAKQSGKELYWQNGCPEGDRFEVTHLAHAFNGGIKINDKAESSVPGLFASGEVAAGAYGADRIGGCMMTATQVFGRRAGRYAAERARRVSLNTSQTELKDPIACVHPRTSDDALWALEALSTRGKEAMGKYAGVLRSKKGLRKCCKILEKCTLQLKALELMGMCKMKRYFEVRNQIITAKLVAESALARSISRGSHYREDDRSQEAGKLGGWKAKKVHSRES